MSRSVQKVGVEIQETITVYDGTGTVVTGLVNGDFVKLLKKNNAVSAVAVTVTEDADAAGDYKVAYTPDSAGTWRLLVRHATYNKKGWQATYDVSAGGVLTATDIAAAVWDFALWAGWSAARVLRKIFSVGPANSTGGAANAVFYAPDGTTPEVTGGAAENGDRTVTNYHS